MNLQGLRFLERWWLRGGLFLLPLAFSYQAYDSWVLPKVLLARLLLLGLVALQVLRALASGRFEVKRTSLDLPLLLFVGCAAVSTALAFNVNTAIFGTYSRYDGLLTTANYVALFWLTVQSLDGPGDVRGLVRALVASGYAFGLLAIAESIVGAVSGSPLSPASATIGNSNVAGTFLAMVVPLALYELFAATSWTGRVLALNAVAVVAIALVLTLSRSSWLGVAAGLFVLLLGWRRPVPRYAPLAAALVGTAAVLVEGLGSASDGLEGALGRRLASIVQPADWGSRPHIWRDTLDLVASRPIFGFGPDNFGLVYPTFQTGAWEVSGTGSQLQIDKAHAETLQIAATEGLVGLAAYVFVLFAIARSFWRGGRDELSVAFIAAVIAFQVPLQLNFTQVGSAFPFYIVLAAAVIIWEDPAGRVVATLSPARAARAAIGVSALVPVTALAVGLVLYPYIADTSLRAAVEADFSGNSPDAQRAAARAGALVPYESVYQVEIGNLAFERGWWSKARSAYEAAATCGSYNPFVFRNLALADIQLGLHDDALAAAQRSLVLDPYDPANQALVDQLNQKSQ